MIVAMTNPVAYAIQIALLAVWLTCAGAGMAGLVLGWPPPREKKPEPPAVEATMIEAALQNDAPPEVASQTEPTPQLPSVDEPPPVPDLPDLPPLPELPAFVEKITPSAPPRPDLKPKKQASQNAARNSNAAPAGTPAVQSLTMGQGEGRQPAPPYPSEALSRHQEGTVMIQLLVGTEGQVLSADVWQASPWPLLNEAAARTVRGRWQFSKGPVRLYRVPIRFRIAR